jgi:putative tryptophan/tyrosine transport system substrate-binding protein
VGVGIVASLARPGGNITGLSAFSTELAGKRVELAKEISPGITRIGLLANMSNPVIQLEWLETTRAARVLGLDAELLDVRNSDDIVRAFETATKRKIGALIVTIDTLMQTNRRLIAELAASHGLPAVHPAREFVDAGGLMSFRVNFADLYYRSAGFVDKILKGVKPADIPIEQPTVLEMVINLKAAKALGLSIPVMVLTRADEVIE